MLEPSPSSVQSSLSTLLARARTFWPLATISTPDSIRYTRALSKARQPGRILDLGCGNHSPTTFRSAYPSALYIGVERPDASVPGVDSQSADSILRLDLDRVDISTLPVRDFDLVVASHVIEHLAKGTRLLVEAASLMRESGLLYVAFPTPASVGFPSRKGTLNFYDDPTHINLVHPEDAIKAIEAAGLSLLFCGRPRSAGKILGLPLQLAMAPLTGGVTGPMLWELYRFQEVLIARKPSALVERVAATGGRGASPR